MSPQEDATQRYRPSSSLPPVVAGLLVVNGLMFLWQLAGSATPVVTMALWPLAEAGRSVIPGAGAPEFHLWQLVTYGFLHGGVLHLLVNMFALWMFGTHIENLWGSRPFLYYYLFCLVGAGLIQLFVASQAAQTGQIYPTVGASGAVFGVLLAFGMMFPNQVILLLFPPIPMKAKYFVVVYGLFSLWAGFSGSMPGVAHFAHVGGMAFGFLLIQYWRGRLPIKPRRRLTL